MTVPRFVGKLDFAPQDPAHPNEWELEQDFGFLREDNILVIAQRGGRVDGASIPRLMWRVVGHPFCKANRFWSVPHDAGYKRFAVVVDLNTIQVTPETMMSIWREIDTPEAFIHSATLPRVWWDRTLSQAMTAMREPAIKRGAVYGAVRAFGARAFRRT